MKCCDYIREYKTFRFAFVRLTISGNGRCFDREVFCFLHFRGAQLSVSLYLWSVKVTLNRFQLCSLTRLYVKMPCMPYDILRNTLILWFFIYPYYESVNVLVHSHLVEPIQQHVTTRFSP